MDFLREFLLKLVWLNLKGAAYQKINTFLGDVFVGTRTSNWCRMIDEIRKVHGKARIPYFSPEPPELLFVE